MQRSINYANIISNHALQKALVEIRSAYIDIESIRGIRGITNCDKSQEVFDLYTKERYGFEVECLINQLADELLDQKYRETMQELIKAKGGGYIKAAAINNALQKGIISDNIRNEIANYVAMKTNHKLYCKTPKECVKRNCDYCEATNLINHDVYAHLCEIINENL